MRVDGVVRSYTFEQMCQTRMRQEERQGDAGVHVEDNLTNLHHLHEPAILHALQNRYHQDEIYTFTGPILL